MRVKEFRNIIENMPDDAEVLIRAQLHQSVQGRNNEYCVISSVNPILTNDQKKLVLNPESKLRLFSWRPENNEYVVCANCQNFDKLQACRKKRRSCEECTMPCNCRKCDPFNSDSPLLYTERPMYTKKEAE
jgi:hypothetical protein